MADPVVKAAGLIQISVTFTNAATPPVPTDPTTITFTYQIVDEATRTVPVQAPLSYVFPAAQVVKDSTGVYHVNIDTTAKPGLLLWKFVGTGAVAQVWDGQLVIRNTAV